MSDNPEEYFTLSQKVENKINGIYIDKKDIGLFIEALNRFK